ncbi:MAG: hypothetical protein IPN86_22190 [Saprospiraceae bacterium]|nr:hypothetical protein [Saprospiraceae bacterium]
MIINNCNGLFHLGNSEKILYFSINGEKYFEGRFWELNDKGSHFLIKSIEFGEKPIKLKEAYFDLPNVNVFIGVATKKDRGFTRNRLSITTKDFNFYLDLDQKSDEIKLMLKNKGGTFINARCLLNYKRTISFEKLIVETQSLNYYLSFIFGRWTSSFCIEVPNTNYKYYFSLT